jgi:3-phosphoshikimate 1-carboxyvinyltransferase
MMAGLLAGRPFRSVLTGDASLRRRPVERVAVPLRAMGARLTSSEGRPPLVIEGGPLRGMEHDLKVASAQVKTAILFAGLQASGRTSVREPAQSRDHTVRLLPLFGVTVGRGERSASVAGGAPLSPVAFRVPGDASSAAFLVVAALVVPGSSVRIDDVLLNPARTAFLEVLRAMGGAVTWAVEREDPEPTGWIEARTSALTGIAVPEGLVPSLIDEVPVLAVAGACAQGELLVTGASELRIKESDRIAALAEGLGRLGADVEERPDGLRIRGGRQLAGATVRAHEDHRIAMSLAVAGLAAAGETEIEGAECIAVSFPEFPALLERGREA